VSSAILYVAIVAIWACVLIPRWLRRSPAVPAPESSDTVTGQADSSGPAAPGAGPLPSRGYGEPRPARREEAYPGDVPYDETRHDETWYEDTSHDDERYDHTGYDDAPRPGDAAHEDTRYEDAGRPEPRRRAPVTREESRRRMLAARRRLLALLLALEAAACALPALGLSAPWVAVPPTIMLAGYLMLLREASRADRELAEREAAAARAHARYRDGRRAGAPAPGYLAPGYEDPAAYPDQAAVRDGDEEPAPAPGEYEDLGHGRDYAPGLAGKYTASNAEDTGGFPGYRRAVGD
jgi:hypothetical protein